MHKKRPVSRLLTRFNRTVHHHSQQQMQQTYMNTEFICWCYCVKYISIFTVFDLYNLKGSLWCGGKCDWRFSCEFHAETNSERIWKLANSWQYCEQMILRQWRKQDLFSKTKTKTKTKTMHLKTKTKTKTKTTRLKTKTMRLKTKTMHLKTKTTRLKTKTKIIHQSDNVALAKWIAAKKQKNYTFNHSVHTHHILLYPFL